MTQKQFNEILDLAARAASSECTLEQAKEIHSTLRSVFEKEFLMQVIGPFAASDLCPLVISSLYIGIAVTKFQLETKKEIDELNKLMEK